MPNFRLEKKLTSYEVSSDLLTDIERYLFEKVPEITKRDSNEIKEDYSVEITDNLGTERLKSISEYPSSSFQDSTNEIMLSLKSFGQKQKYLGVRIRFNRDKLFSHIAVEYDGTNAREITISIFAGIKRIMDPYKTNNRFYHPPGLLDMALFLIMIQSLLTIIFWCENLIYTQRIAALSIIIILILYWGIGKKIHPYTVFDSRKSRNYKKWSNWLFYGILGFIIFDLALAFILKLFYGM